MPERMIRFPELKMLSGLSRSTVYLQINDGLFPRPILLGRRMVGWRESEVSAIIAARIRAETDDAIRTIVTRLEDERQNVAAIAAPQPSAEPQATAR